MSGPEKKLSRDSSECAQFVAALGTEHIVHAVKLYRIELTTSLRIPTLPCLDHEAMLHEGIEPHAAAYIEDKKTQCLHEIVMIPARSRIEIDVVSTSGEFCSGSHQQITKWLTGQFPGYQVRVTGPSLLRGDQRVARACRGQVSLREVLTGSDLDCVARKVDRLRTISSLMEKESRVASWSIRTVTGPLLAVAGFVAYQIFEILRGVAVDSWLTWLRYVILGVLGAIFLYFGLKAVHLTEMANRVWKRCAEYDLILKERRRLAQLDAE